MSHTQIETPSVITLTPSTCPRCQSAERLPFTSLPPVTDGCIHCRLQRKYAEYQQRYGFKAPELDPHGFIKYMVLGMLLADGQVDINALRERFRVCEWFNEGCFADAVKVIAAYNSGDLSLVHGGTGF